VFEETLYEALEETLKIKEKSEKCGIWREMTRGKARLSLESTSSVPPREEEAGAPVSDS
jgi:hypothetical protein